MITFRYGDLSVVIDVVNARVSQITLGTLSWDGNRSESIDQMAIPILEREAISAQSSSIQSVSGASFTSAAFESSLQGALGELGMA